MKSRTKSCPNFPPSVLDFAKTLKIAKKNEVLQDVWTKKNCGKTFRETFLVSEILGTFFAQHVGLYVLCHICNIHYIFDNKIFSPRRKKCEPNVNSVGW